MTALSPASDTAPLNRIRVVLVETSHPGNVGSAARAMKTMGLSNMVIVNPRLPAPQHDAQAVALASGATDVLQTAKVVATLQEALADVVYAVGFTARKRELTHPHVGLREAAGLVMSQLAAQTHSPVALVFGNEAMCLSNDDVDRCQLLASVPANPVYSSLNLAQTVQVAAYEMMMASGSFAVAPDVPRESATSGEIEALIKHLEFAAIESGFLDPNSPKRFMTRMRRLATRAGLEREEVAILRGLISSLQKPVRRNIPTT
ncbi:MAG: RNA methyltransferase [Rhodocyclaceae bacterium]|nr:RNA methyltransferase [Rhodocyclaceae bacterium]MCA3082654.1 RNA methyltransferase [Rhodocyclaceae bacterium]